MFDDEYSTILDSSPKPPEVIQELFTKARATSQERFFLALVNFSRFFAEGKASLAKDPQPTWALDQFVEFLRALLAVQPKDIAPGYENIIRRLHMLAYSQFWEHKEIKTLLNSLVAVCAGEEVQPRPLFGQDKGATSSFYKSLDKKATKHDLLIGPCLQVAYRSQIRNAFAHSDFFERAGFICLENYDSKREEMIPSLKIATWDKLWSLSALFITSLLLERANALRRLRDMVPYPVMIAGNPYCIDTDKRDGSFVLKERRVIS